MVCLPCATNTCPVESVRTQFQPVGHYSAAGEGSLKTKSPWATARERARSDGPSSSALGSSQRLGKAPLPTPLQVHAVGRCITLLPRFCAGPWQGHGFSRRKAEAVKGRSALAPLAGNLGALPMMFASRDSKLGSTLVTGGPVAPRRLLGQHICKDRQRGPIPVTVTVPCSDTWAQE